jgi:hypothetical protein
VSPQSANISLIAPPGPGSVDFDILTKEEERNFDELSGSLERGDVPTDGRSPQPDQSGGLPALLQGDDFPRFG